MSPSWATGYGEMAEINLGKRSRIRRTTHANACYEGIATPWDTR